MGLQPKQDVTFTMSDSPSFPSQLLHYKNSLLSSFTCKVIKIYNKKKNDLNTKIIEIIGYTISKSCKTQLPKIVIIKHIRKKNTEKGWDPRANKATNTVYGGQKHLGLWLLLQFQ